MKLSKAIGLILSVAIFALSLLFAFILITYMTEYGISRIAMALMATAIGTALSIAAFMRLKKSKMKKRTGVILLVAMFLFLCAPVLSMFLLGRVTYSRFGLTVYGLMPIPALDITVSSNGMLWFRDKNHHVTLAEVTGYISQKTEAIVIGTGWNGLVNVDPEVKEINGVEVIVLKSPEAFQKYNELKAMGKEVVLIAHSTC